MISEGTCTGEIPERCLFLQKHWFEVECSGSYESRSQPYLRGLFLCHTHFIIHVARTLLLRVFLSMPLYTSISMQRSDMFELNLSSCTVRAYRRFLSASFLTTSTSSDCLITDFYHWSNSSGPESAKLNQSIRETDFFEPVYRINNSTDLQRN